MPTVCKYSCYVISPRISTLWWQNFSLCLGPSEFKFLVHWVCNHQSYLIMHVWSHNRFPELALDLLPGTWSPMPRGEMTKEAFECPRPRLISVTKKRKDERVPDKCHIPYLLTRGLKAHRAFCAYRGQQDTPVGVPAGGIYRLGLFLVPKVNASGTQSEPCLPLTAAEHRGWESQVPWMRVHRAQ